MFRSGCAVPWCRCIDSVPLLVLLEIVSYGTVERKRCDLQLDLAARYSCYRQWPGKTSQILPYLRVYYASGQSGAPVILVSVG
jgi:hypothetical protein